MDQVEARMWWYRALHARLLDAIGAIEGPLLDAGCGTGGFLARLRARRDAVVGLEWHEAAARIAAAKSGRPVIRGSINALPFKDRSFACVTAADVLCHEAVDPDCALAEIRRVLRPGGRVIVNMPAFRSLMSAHDVEVHNARRMNAREVRMMMQDAGFSQPRIRYWNGLLLPLMILRRKLLRPSQGSDVAVFPPWLDHTFHAMTELERHLPIALPAGGSVLAIAERP